MLKKYNFKSGFTLIELLVVISIISFLVTLAMTSLNNARIKSRDAKRLADITQLQKALDLYYDENGSYIISGNCGANSPNGGWCNDIQSPLNNHWVRDGATNLSKFMVKDPIDPKPAESPRWIPVNGGTYFYYSNGYGGSGQWYMIIFGLEDHNHEFQDYDGVTACNGHYFHYGNGHNGVITIGRDCQI